VRNAGVDAEPISNLCENQTKAVFDLKLMVGGGEHEVVLDESGFCAYCGDVDWGLNFLSVPGSLSPKMLCLSTG